MGTPLRRSRYIDEVCVESRIAHESIESLDARRHHAVHLSIGDILKQVVLHDTAPIIDGRSDFAGAPDDGSLAKPVAKNVDMSHPVQHGQDHGLGSYGTSPV